MKDSDPPGLLGEDAFEWALRPGVGAAPGFVWSAAFALIEAHRGRAQLRRRLLGLERIKGAQRAPELGDRRAAIAVGRSAPITEVGAGSRQPSRSCGCQILGLNPRTADQREAGAGGVPPALLELLGLLPPGWGTGRQPRSGGQAHEGMVSDGGNYYKLAPHEAQEA